MKRLFVTQALIAFTAYCLTSCTSGVGQSQYPPSERARVDSIVRSNRSIDSLVAVAGRFAAEGNLLGQAVSYRELGRAYRNSTLYQEAIDTHLKGLEASREICDTLEIVQALNNIGTAYRRMDMLEEAASWHYQGLALCEQWSDTTSVGLKNRVVSLNGLGNVLLSMGNDSLAMASFREALKGETTLGSLNGMAINYANIGALMEDRGQIDSARYYYGRSLECNMQNGSDLGVSLCHGHFGRLAEKDGDLDSAYDEYKLAYDHLSGSSDKWHWLESCTALARISMKRGDVSAARLYLAESTAVAESLGSAAHLADIYYLHYQMDADAGRYKDSLKWLEKYSDCMNRLYAERNEDAIYELRSKYEREKSLNELEVMRESHLQKERRDRMLLSAAFVVLALAVIAIAFLFYSLRLRSRNNKILKDLDRTKNNYFTDIAHEFRTPLTIIHSASRSIMENAEDEGLKEDASDISRHSKGLLNLVNQVLDVAKMTSGLAPDPIWRQGNVVSFISGICQRNRRYAESKGISLVYEYSEESLEMDFVPDMMVRIVQNLLANALKFSDKGTEVRVAVSRKRDGDADLLCISVRDQGVGVTKSQMAEIFTPFYQVEGRYRDMGTGLGLSVVKFSAEAMNGRVSVESILGEGSEFIVTIPVRHDKAVSEVEGETEAQDAVCVPEPDGVQTADALSQDQDVPRILIVEDTPEVARWEMRQLDSSYAFYFASDGAEGLRKAEEIVPDLIISDVMMPVMDGVEMCRRIRGSELLCHIPVIMVTAKVDHEDRLKGLEAGADAYLEKPYDETELDLRVRKLLQQRILLKNMFSERFESAYVPSVTEDPGYSAADRAFLKKFDELLEDAFVSGKVACEDLASAMCIGRTQLNRKIKAITGYKTSEYILMARLAKAKKLLCTTSMPVGEVALSCGIEDVSYFSTLFRKHTGLTPSAFRNL